MNTRQSRGLRLFAFSIVTATTRVAPDPHIVARDAHARMYQLTEGIYTILHDDATMDWRTGAVDWPHSNVGVIVGREGVLVVDSDYLPSRAAADIALIRTVTTVPVRYLVNTHWHGDHTHGNAVYRDSFPGVSIIGQRENQRFIALHQQNFPTFMIDTKGFRQGVVRDDRVRLSVGKDTNGVALTADQTRRLKADIQQREGEIRELSQLVVAPPTVLFDRDLVIDLGDKRVSLHNWGRGNSPDDVTAYVLSDGVLFTGDILVHPVPYAWHAYPTHWIDVLRQVEAMKPVVLVPGHGEIQTDYAYIELVRALFEAATSRVDTLLRQGKSLAEIKKRVNLDEFKSRFVHGGDATAIELWDDSIMQALIERSYWCVSGYDC